MSLEVSPLAAILRRYCFAYTATHDLSVCDDIMVEDYTLHMGDIDVRGRDENYKPAAGKQLRQFPGLGMSVHDLLITTERAALHFSEYGRSSVNGTPAAWSGISTYRWNGTDRLVDCRVEQDYFARRRQLNSGTPDPVERPAHDPWVTSVEEPSAEVGKLVREWLKDGGISALPEGALDDEISHAAERIVLDAPQVTVLDCVAGEARAAFHARATGTVTTWPGGDGSQLGATASVYYAGIVRVDGGSVTTARVISDRLAAERRLRAGWQRPSE